MEYVAVGWGDDGKEWVVEMPNNVQGIEKVGDGEEDELMDVVL